MKHRVFRFLVEEMGFRTLGFEASWWGLIDLNQCLLPGGPPIASAFKNLGYWPWETEEVMALLQWIRSFNETNQSDSPVQLVGLDVPVEPPKDLILAVDQYFARVAPEAEVRSIFRGDFLSALRKLTNIQRNAEALADQGPARVEAYVTVLDPAIVWLNVNRDLCVFASSEAEYLTNVRLLESVAIQLLRMATADEAEYLTIRDRYLAGSVSWWLGRLGEDTRMAIWAHNGHIARGLTAGESWKKMGLFLAETYGDAYLPIGFSFAEGSFNAIGMWRGTATALTAEPLIPGCYEAAFQTVSLPQFIVDLRDLEPGTAVSEWMGIERGFRAIGAMYGDAADLGWGWGFPTVLPLSYDVMIHIETSTPAAAWF